MSKVKTTKVKQIIGETMPPNTWTDKYTKQYTDFYHLCMQTANIYDNSALREDREFSNSTLQLVQNYLINSGRQYVPGIGSLCIYLNTNRLSKKPWRKSKESNELAYQFSDKRTKSRTAINNVVAKRK
jgi:hypothetical protein